MRIRTFIWSSNLETEAFVTFGDMFYLSWYAQPVHLFDLAIFHLPQTLRPSQPPTINYQDKAGGFK